MGGNEVSQLSTDLLAHTDLAVPPRDPAGRVGAHSMRARRPSTLARMMAPSFTQMQILQAISGAVTLGMLVWGNASAWWWLLALVAYFLTGCLGLTVTLHRALTHRAIKLPRPLEVMFTLFGAAGGSGSSVAWAAMHRSHHANVDNENDPHSPEKLGWRLIFSVYDYDFDPRHAKDLLRDKFHMFVHRYYTVLLLAWCFALGAIDIRLCVFVFMVPAFVQITVSNLTSLLTHSQGYRRYETRDHSANNPLIALLGWGEGWHNNHHAAPLRWSFSRRWWEIDPGAVAIAGLIALGLVPREPVVRESAVSARSSSS
jgi:stearoyl-CoA desaturase (delta-9 desaturase)